MGQVSGRPGQARRRGASQHVRMKRRLLVLIALVAGAPAARAEESFRWDQPSLTANVGLIQPLLLGGANFELDFRYSHFVVSYSHGWSLDLDGDRVVGEMSRQRLALHLPYSTGLGLGPSIYVGVLNSFFDVRLEAKIHRFEVSYASVDGAGHTEIACYTTFTLGAGVYWTYLPFAARGDVLRGVGIATSVRFWPKVGSTLPGDELEYDNRSTGQTERHRAANIGIADTPLVVNISIGYLFQ